MPMSGPHRHRVSLLLTLLAATCARIVPSLAAESKPDSSGFVPNGLRTERILDRETLEAVGIRRPARLAWDQEGNLHVLDAETRHVVKLDPRGQVLFDVGGYGQDETSLELPVDIAVDRDQSLLVLDRGRGALVAFDRAGRFLGQRLFQGAAAEVAREPGARLVLDRFGKLWLLSAQQRDLIALDDRLQPARTGRFLMPEESLRAPLAAAIGPEGDVWVYDEGRTSLLRFDASGRLRLTMPPTHIKGFGVPDLAVDRAGYLYAAVPSGQEVVAYGKDGYIHTLRVFGGDRIAWKPRALALGPGRRVAVADPERDEIQVLVSEPGVEDSKP